MGLISMGVARAGGVAACLLVVAGCAPSDLSDPVPTTAEAPFVCDGVPLTGLQRLTGIRDLTVEDDTSGPWDEHFTCHVYDGDRLVVWVLYMSTEWLGYGSLEDQITEARTRHGALQIVADAPGAGYVEVRDKEMMARWVCEDNTRTDVTVYATGGADMEEDLARYMVSILPWACGDAEAPPRTVED